MNIIISDSLDGDKDILLSRQAMEKMILLPNNWPFHSDDTEIITSKLTKEEAVEIISDLKSGNIERCLKTSTKDNDTEKDKERKARDELIAD